MDGLVDMISADDLAILEEAISVRIDQITQEELAAFRIDFIESIRKSVKKSLEKTFGKGEGAAHGESV